MPPLAWLVAALVAGAGAYVVGSPAVRARRERESRDTNTERYLAWRGRASESPRESSAPPDERTRLIAAGVLAVTAVVALIGFFLAG